MTFGCFFSVRAEKKLTGEAYWVPYKDSEARQLVAGRPAV